jgi:uncharacterized protein
MDFEWDDLKAVANIEKHSVSFTEAKTVFANELAVVFDDEAHSVDERREDYYWSFPIQSTVTNFFH